VSRTDPAEDLAGPTAKEYIGELPAEFLRGIGATDQLTPEEVSAIDGRDEALKPELLALRDSECSYRDLAAPLERTEESAFSGRSHARRRIVQRPEEFEHPLVPLPHGNAERALPWRREPGWRLQDLTNSVFALKASDTGMREDRRVEIALLEPSKAGVEVATQIHDLEIGAEV
jgi:hypothetical protein